MVPRDLRESKVFFVSEGKNSPGRIILPGLFGSGIGVKNQWVSSNMATNSAPITQELPLIFLASPQKMLMMM